MLRLVFIVALSVFAVAAHAGSPGVRDTQERLRIMLLNWGVGVLDYEFSDCLSILEEIDLVHEQHAIDFSESKVDNYGTMSLIQGSVQSLDIDKKRKSSNEFLSLYFSDQGHLVGDALMHLSHICGQHNAVSAHDHHW